MWSLTNTPGLKCGMTLGILHGGGVVEPLKEGALLEDVSLEVGLLRLVS